MCIVHQTYLRQLWYNYEKTPGLPLPILSGEFRNDRRMLYVIVNFAPNTTVSSFFFFEDAWSQSCIGDYSHQSTSYA